ncbi:MAG: hypothetical protein ACOH1T_01605 [Microbacteriaceae bacterium]
MTLPTQSAFTKTTDSIPENAEKIRVAINECIDKFNGRGKAAGFAIWITGKADDIKEALDDLVQKFYELVDFIAQLLSPGNPVSMVQKAANWRTVQAKLSGQVAELSSSQFPSTYSWQGRDGWAYSGIVNDQGNAVSGIFPHADAMASHLESHGLNIIDGWSDIAQKVLGIQLDLIKDASAFITADPLEWLDIVPKIVTLVANLIQNIADAFEQLEDYALTAIAEMQQLKGNLSTVTGSRGGAWPAPGFA